MAIVKTPSVEFLSIIHIIHVLWFCNGYNSLSFMVHIDGDCDDSIHGILNYVDIIHIQCDTPVTCTNKSLNSNFVLYLLSHYIWPCASTGAKKCRRQDYSHNNL